MAKQGLGAPTAGSSKCDSKSIFTEKLDECNSFSEDTLKWLSALEKNLRVTQTTCLDLGSQLIGVKEAAEIYKFLPNSQVVDLKIICRKNLKGGAEDLLRLLLTSQIKKLSFCHCMVSRKELLYLMEGLKNTRVTDLIVKYKCGTGTSLEFDSDQQKEFMSLLQKTPLTKLNCGEPFDLTPLLCSIQNTSVTHLKISGTTVPMGILCSFFSTLRHTAITNMKLRNVEISEDALRQLSLNLKHSKVVNLHLARNNMGDSGLDILAEGLAPSKISSLDISCNSITGSSCFGLCLKDSLITNLNLSFLSITSKKLLLLPHFLRHSSIVKLDVSYCGLSDELGQQLIKCLRFSKVTHLNLSHNQLGFSSVTELAAVLKDTALNSVDFSHNSLLPEVVIILGGCLKGSKLKSVSVGSQYKSEDPAGIFAFSTFLDKTKDTSVKIVDLSFNRLGGEYFKSIVAGLVNTALNHLNLSHNHIGEGLVCLAPWLKFTAITHLDLSLNNLCDVDAEMLARCIPETQIIELILMFNQIGDGGAKFLATRLKGSKLIHLNLFSNKIGNEGLKALALHAEGTFLKILNVTDNPGNRDFLINRILLENQTSVHHFVSFFKQIAPESNNNRFRFNNNINDKDVATFLEESLLFFKTVLEQSSAASVLVAEDSLSLSMEKSITLLKEEFPRQFTAFVANQIEANPAQHVDLLRKAEEMELTEIIELLLKRG